MSDLKHLSYDELLVRREQCKKYMDTLNRKLHGQEVRMEWIEKYIQKQQANAVIDVPNTSWVWMKSGRPFRSTAKADYEYAVAYGYNGSRDDFNLLANSGEVLWVKTVEGGHLGRLVSHFSLVRVNNDR